MRFPQLLPSLLLLLLPLAALAQDTVEAETGTEQEATPTVDAAPTSTDNGNENTKDTSQPWNVTYFSYPTRNNYWVNDNENKATWSPVNVATNLLLSHSNSSILPQRVMLQQNIPGGVGTFSTKITGYAPANNYLLILTIAGNPDQKLAQSQGFYIKANGTAAPQQVTAQGNQATATVVSDPGSTQQDSGNGAAQDAGQTGNTATVMPSPTPGAMTPSSAGRIGAGVGIGIGAAVLAAAIVAPVFLV